MVKEKVFLSNILCKLGYKYLLNYQYLARVEIVFLLSILLI